MKIMGDIYELEKSGFDVRSGITYAGGESRYIATLSMYASSYDTMSEKLKELWKAGNTGDFAITVHAVKSSSKLIGAEEVFELARSMEEWAASGDVKNVGDNLDRLLEMYAGVVKTIRPYANTGTQAEAVDLIGRKEAIELLHLVAEDFDNFDDLSAIEHLKRLSGYLFDSELKSKFDYLLQCADEFLYDDGLRTANEMIVALE